MKVKSFIKELTKLLEKHNLAIKNRIELINLSEVDSVEYDFVNEIMHHELWGRQRGNFIIPRIIEKKEIEPETTYNAPKCYGFTFQEFTSPIDGKRIASTQQLRDHERQYGVKQVGNDLITKKEQQ